MAEQSWQATGLTCDHCSQSVTKQLLEIDGMQSVHVSVHPDVPSVISTVGSRDFTSDEIGFALRQAGRYKLSN